MKQNLVFAVLMCLIVCGCGGNDNTPNPDEPGLIESYTVRAIPWDPKLEIPPMSKNHPNFWSKLNSFGYEASDDTGEFYMTYGELGPALIVGLKWTRNGETYYAKLKNLFMNNGYTNTPYYEEYKGSDGITEAIMVMGQEGEIMFLHLTPYKQGFSMEVATYRTFKHPNN